MRTSGPRSIAPAVAAKNAPPEHFLNATTDSQRDNYVVFIHTLPRNRECVFSLVRTSGPRSVAPAVAAKNAPRSIFLTPRQILKEIIYPEWDFIVFLRLCRGVILTIRITLLTIRKFVIMGQKIIRGMFKKNLKICNETAFKKYHI